MAHNNAMTYKITAYKSYRFPEAIISHTIWLYYRFSLSFREVEELMAARGVEVSGRLIAEKAVEMGLQPILAGRSPESIRDLAGEMGLEWRSFGVQDTAHVAGQLRDIDALINY